MVAYTPWLDKEEPINKALDAAHAKGIGLISMKQAAGTDGARILAEVAKHVPTLAQRGLTPFQGLLHAIWTDERIATSCVSLKNVEQITENAKAARNFEPLKAAEMRGLRDAFLAAGPTMCANCDGRCAVAAGTDAELGSLARFLTYYRAAWPPGRRPPSIRRPARRRPRLGRGRPRRRAGRLPEPPRLRRPPAAGRRETGLSPDPARD